MLSFFSIDKAGVIIWIVLLRHTAIKGVVHVFVLISGAIYDFPLVVFGRLVYGVQSLLLLS